MKTSILFAFTLVLFNGCISTSSISSLMGVPEEELNRIPKGAKNIIVTINNATSNEVYSQIKNALIERSHRIEKDDKESFYLTTEGKDVGESTLQRMVISISKVQNDCRIVLNTEYKPGMEAQMLATGMTGINVNTDWTEVVYDIKTRSGIAFIETYIIAKRIDRGIITYK